MSKYVLISDNGRWVSRYGTDFRLCNPGETVRAAAYVFPDIDTAHRVQDEWTLFGDVEVRLVRLDFTEPAK